jgi:hypothetical protein
LQGRTALQIRTEVLRLHMAVVATHPDRVPAPQGIALVLHNHGVDAGPLVRRRSDQSIRSRSGQLEGVGVSALPHHATRRGCERCPVDGVTDFDYQARHGHRCAAGLRTSLGENRDQSIGASLQASRHE